MNARQPRWLERQLCAVGRLLVASVTLATAAAGQELPTARIDAAVRAAFPAGGPGVIVGVMRNGSVLHVASSGWADIANRQPFTTTTRVDLASVSKAFTAMGVMILIDRGKVGLDTDVRSLLPELDRRRYPTAIPLAALLGMTAGLADYEDLFDDLSWVTNRDVARAVGARQPAWPPGTRYAYSNSSYALLALISERVSKRRFATFLEQSIFDPIGMSGALVVDRPGMAVDQRAVGYRREGGRFVATRYDTSVVGDGQVFASLNEMAAWEHALRAGTLVSRGLLRRAFSSGRLLSGQRTGYGFGWSVSRRDGVTTIEHDGSWDGTATFIRIHLGAGPSIVVLSNLEDADVEGLGDRVDALLRGEDAAPAEGDEDDE